MNKIIAIQQQSLPLIQLFFDEPDDTMSPQMRFALGKLAETITVTQSDISFFYMSAIETKEQ